MRSVALRLYQLLGLLGEQPDYDPVNPPQRNAPSPLPAFFAFIRSRLRLLSPPPKAASIADAFRQRLDGAIAELQEQTASCDWFEVSAGSEQWLDTGIEVRAGDSITLMADGRLYLSRPLDVSVGPKMGLWYRIGHGGMCKLPAASTVITAAESGSLQLMAAIPGAFGDPHGGFDDSMPSIPVSGQFSLAVIRWQGEVKTALEKAAEVDAELFSETLSRLQQPVKPPEGWRYFWRLGESEIFQAHAEDGSLCCHTHADGGILQFPVDIPLEDDLQFSWQWCVDQLPSQLPEHIQPTHDYLSIAIEFDNGLDLTYMWSSNLAVDTIFQCPLPWWDQREIHWVLRNDPGELGQWLDEHRNVLADYRKAIGGPLPNNLVAVWLIANSAFQRGIGECCYRNIALQSASQSLEIPCYRPA